MSHRKFERPRHGSLGFLPRKRCRLGQGRVKAFPKDDQTMKPHFTAFMGYKSGMTHVVREIERPGSKLNKRDAVEAATVIDCPPMVVVGVVGYTETPSGWKVLETVWAQYLSEEFRRRMYKKWSRSDKKAFTCHCACDKAEDNEAKLKNLRARSEKVRAICHTQVSKTPTGQKRAHVMEIQINGGSIPEKVDFVHKLFECELNINSIFSENDIIDTIAINRGKGFQGVVKRWGVTRLPRKTHRGLRKVACIGAWHPARVQFQIARAGQMGYHHRTVRNNKILRIGNGTDVRSGSTNYDITEKGINPMGGFVGYGLVRNDFLLIKGSITGPRKRAITLRKSLVTPNGRRYLEPVNLKFIDTASKIGHGRFQTSEEKNAYYGPLARKIKRQLQREAAAA